jgi:transcriptional regulator with XRE-family HTH domain
MLRVTPLSFAQRMYDMRFAKGWCQGDLAQRAGISRTAMCQIETGSTRVPRAATLKRLAEALEVSIEEVRSWLDDDAEPTANCSERHRLRSQLDRDKWAPFEGEPPSLPDDSDVQAISDATAKDSIIDPERPMANDGLPRAFSGEGELMSKLHDLLHSRIGQGVAHILEELHGHLLRSRSSS